MPKKDANKFSKDLVEENKFLIQAAQDDFLTFCQLMDPNYEVAWFHEVIATELKYALEQVLARKPARIILSVPPRHGKTHTAAALFPAWVLGKHPEMKFILSTYSGELSEKTGMLTRDLIASPRYKSIFPDISLRTDSKAKRKWMTDSGGTYYGVGVGGSVTGVGGNFLILDDPHKDRAEAESTLQRDRVGDYFRSTLYNRLNGPGAIIVIMQRWHDDDLVGRLMELMEKQKEAGEPYDDWRIINFPAIAETKEVYTDPYGNTRTVRLPGEPLWESQFPLTALAQIRAASGTYAWSAQFQQDPILAENQEFKKEYFKYYEPDSLKEKYCRYHTLVDSAISKNPDADNTVVLTIAKEVNGPNIYRVREDAGHFTPKQTVDLIFKHQVEYDSAVHLEVIAYQKALKYAVEEEQRKREMYFTIRETKRGNKETRVRGLLPLYERGVIHHLHFDQDYERELLQFPRGKRDDRADCMSFMLQAIQNTGRGGVRQYNTKPYNGYFQN